MAAPKKVKINTMFINQLLLAMPTTLSCQVDPLQKLHQLTLKELYGPNSTGTTATTCRLFQKTNNNGGPRCPTDDEYLSTCRSSTVKLIDDDLLEAMLSTQSSMGRFVNNPKLLLYYLQKPPFLFTRDVVVNVSRKSGLLAGLFTTEEICGREFNNKSRIAFFRKLVAALKLTTGEPFPIMGKTSAWRSLSTGKYPFYTHWLLQVIGLAVEKRMCSHLAVELAIRQFQKEEQVEFEEQQQLSLKRSLIHYENEQSGMDTLLGSLNMTKDGEEFDMEQHHQPKSRRKITGRISRAGRYENGYNMGSFSEEDEDYDSSAYQDDDEDSEGVTDVNPVLEADFSSTMFSNFIGKGDSMDFC